jgi:hypothetical protein
MRASIASGHDFPMDGNISDGIGARSPNNNLEHRF